jgi:cytochrome b561
MTPKEQELINYAHFFSTHPWLGVLLAVLVVWELVWKGIALWESARNSQKTWFVFILILNTVGILPMVYIFFFSKKKENQ